MIKNILVTGMHRSEACANFNYIDWFIKVYDTASCQCIDLITTSYVKHVIKYISSIHKRPKSVENV